MAKEYKGVIFDFNGVMIDDYPLQKQSWTEIAEELRGKPVTDEEMVNQIRGIPTRNTIIRMVYEAGESLTDKKISEYEQRKEAIIQELFRISPLARLTKGLEDFLNRLSEKHIPISIASSSSLVNLQIIFDRFNLYQWFDISSIVHKDTTLNGKKVANKPKPDPYIAAAQIIGVPTHECVVFEDAKSGILSSYTAGVEATIAINSNPEHLALLSVLPGVIKGISDFTQITVKELFHYD